MNAEAFGPDLVVIIEDDNFDDVILVRSREENQIKRMAVRPDLVVGIDVIFDDLSIVSIVRSREENETRQMAVSPALVVLDVFFYDVSIKDHDETKQMAAMPDLVVI